MACKQILQEFDALADIVKRIPHQAQKGLFRHDLDWTCLAISSEYIAIGTNIGLVFLYDRSKKTLERLQGPVKEDVVTTVKMKQSVETVVAMGTGSGTVCIFQLPSLLPGRVKQLHMFTVKDIHHSAITSIVWSQNAMKLFSGDEDGVVVCTEINYHEEQSKSYFVCKEPHEVVQLDYAHRTLLITTRSRAILCALYDNNEITQIGKKARKQLGPFGAVFLPGVYKADDAVIFCSRPGLRLWKSNIEGVVQATYIFKDLVKSDSQSIHLLPDTIQSIPRNEDRQFACLEIYQETQLVTVHDGTLYVIDPGLGTFIGYHSNIGNVIDFAVCEDEIFLLRRGCERSLVRVAEKAYFTQERSDSNQSTGSISSSTDNLGNTSPVSVLTHTASLMSKSIVGAFKEVGDKIQSVHEGQKPISESPPWGSAQPQNSIESQIERTDPSREIDSEYTPSNSTTSESEKTSPEGTMTQLSDVSAAANVDVAAATFQEESVPPGAPPIVRLQSNDLLMVEIPQPSLSSSIHEKQMTPTNNKWGSITKIQSTEDNIVFSSHTKKHKKRKKKSGGLISGRDDTSSINSLELEYNLSDTGSVNSLHNSREPSLQFEIDNRSINNDIVVDPSDFGDKLIHPGAPSKGDSLEHKFEKTEFTQTSLHRQSEDNIEAVMQSSSVEPTINHNDELLSLSKEQITSPTCIEIDNTTSETGDLQEALPQVTPVLHSLNNINNLRVDLELANQNLTNLTVTEENKDIVLTTIDNANDSIKSDDATEIDSHHSCSAPPSEYRKSGTPTESPVDDFYSMYRDASVSSLSSSGKYQPEQEISIQDALSYSSVVEYKSPEAAAQQLNAPLNVTKRSSTVRESAVRVCRNQATNPEEVNYAIVSIWEDIPAPGNLQSLCVTSKHVWCTDKQENLYVSYISDLKLAWKKLDCLAKVISVSSSGWIVWRIHKGSVYVASKISPRAPAGTQWTEIAREVTSISVSDTYAWYTKTNGDILMQKGLTRDRPCYRSLKVSCKQALRKVVCHSNVVWALTYDQELLVRTGISTNSEEGNDWKNINRKLICHFDLCDDKTAWVVDLLGRLWFTTNVTQEQPEGSGQWWQVPTSAYLMQDPNAMEYLRSMTDISHSITRLLNKEKGGLLSASRNGIWYCPGFKNTLHICRGNILGHRWEICTPLGMPTVAKWDLLSAAGAKEDKGVVWAQQPSGGLFCFSPTNYRPIEVTPPELSHGFLTISAVEEVLWTLLPSGTIYIRIGMSSRTPQGTKWNKLDLAQLGNSRLVHLCCGKDNVWAVDHKGRMFLRIGVVAPVRQSLSPAWVIVDGKPNTIGARFTHVYTGPHDWMVWAIDSKNGIYVRKGVTESMPIGTHWLYVEGTQADTLCVSESYVYACSDGEILVRCGIMQGNVAGNYWRKLPGAALQLSAGFMEDIWALTPQYQLCHRFIHNLNRQQGAIGVGQSPHHTEKLPDDWEII